MQKYTTVTIQFSFQLKSKTKVNLSFYFKPEFGLD